MQGIWPGTFRKPIDWTSDKANIKCKSLSSPEVVYLRTKLKGLKECFVLFCFFPWGRVRAGGDYVGEKMSILHFFPQRFSHGGRIYRSK